MMQTRSRTSRRSKVTVHCLPVELIIEIFRRVQKLIGRCDFKQDCWESMRLDQEYCNNLLAFALSSKEWTTIAQAELFRNIILNNQSKTGQFLESVRMSKELRSHAESSLSIRFGREERGDYDALELEDELDEIALYCPNVVEISCYQVAVRLDYFRNMKKLDKFTMTLGSILPPSNSGAPLQTITIPITLLSLQNVTIPSPLDPASLPLVRSLQLFRQTCQPLRLLLPQLASLRFGYVNSIADINLLIQASTSITSLALHEMLMSGLNDDLESKTIIKERIVDFRLFGSAYGETGGSTLVTIIAGSKVMKKVILDGVNLNAADQGRPKLLQTLKIVKEACKKKKVELWKENFDVGNGKVDLEK